ncbi:hypothetical protein [Micromonospora sp. DT41]|uniref:hypothetical protein n=1 Tax=Micromonospora sp. DT41 TaxID=3393437 RepID=UPI003CEA63A5
MFKSGMAALLRTTRFVNCCSRPTVAGQPQVRCAGLLPQVADQIRVDPPVGFSVRLFFFATGKHPR